VRPRGAHSRSSSIQALDKPLLAFAGAVLSAYALIWGAQLFFPNTLVSAGVLVALTLLGAWIVRPGWNVRPKYFGRYPLILFALVLASAALASCFVIAFKVPLPYDLAALNITAAVPAILAITGLEELLFRQVMFRALEQRGVSSRTTIVTTALAFGGGHLGPLLPGSAIGATFYLLQSAHLVWIGILLGEIRRTTQSWLTSWLGHFAYNVTLLSCL
jgi:Type II CAAX prenyl endopeptidase Rce1-like